MPHHHHHGVSEKSQLGLKVTALGFGLNAFMVVMKIFFGIQGNSRALVADGIHSLADFITDLITALGVYLGNLPPDEDHRFGHQKIETVAEILMGVTLMGIAGFLMLKSGIAVYEHEVTDLSISVIYVVAISFVLNEFLYYKTLAVSKKIKSKVIFANAWHHRTDSLSSLAILIGLSISYFVPSLRILDAYLSLMVGVIVFKIGIDTSWDALKRIVDTVSPKLYQEIEEVAAQAKKVRSIHNIRIRYIGNQLHIEFHIEVDPQMTIYDGHEVSHRLKEAIEKKIENVYDVMIHIEPEGDDRFED